VHNISHAITSLSTPPTSSPFLYSPRSSPLPSRSTWFISCSFSPTPPPPPKSPLFPYTTLFRSPRRMIRCGHISRDALPKSPARRSEEHTSELQSQSNLVCRLLLEKKKAVILAAALSVHDAFIVLLYSLSV